MNKIVNEFCYKMTSTFVIMVKIQPNLKISKIKMNCKTKKLIAVTHENPIKLVESNHLL